MRVRYYYHGPVAKWVRELTIEFVNWYKQNYIVEHEIIFRLYVAGYLDSGRPTGDYGCFAPRCGNACIWLATWWFYWRDAGTVKDRAQAREEYLDTLRMNCATTTNGEGDQMDTVDSKSELTPCSAGSIIDELSCAG